jgi:hypothetical protein
LHDFSGPPALRRNDNDSGAFQDTAEVYAPEITELECNLTHDKPNQPRGNAEQNDHGASLDKHGKSQNKERPDSKQRAHHDPGKKMKDKSRHLSHHVKITLPYQAAVKKRRSLAAKGL